jgi:spermidine/putrescine transport system permease protein
MKTRALSIYVIYAWLFCFGFLPIALILIISFLTDNSISLVSLPWTFHNYHEITSLVFVHVLVRSLTIAIITTFLCLILAFPFSYILIHSKYQTMLLALLVIPLWTSTLIRTYAMIAILKLNGLLNKLLLAFHLIEQPIAFLYTNTAVLVGLVYNLFPFMVLPLFSNMERFDFTLIEAAQDLGARRLTVFFRIFLPHTTQGIIAGSMMTFLPAMTLFYVSNILGGARSVLLGNLIQNQFLVTENWPAGATTSVILTLTMLPLLFFYRPKKKSTGEVLDVF